MTVVDPARPRPRFRLVSANSPMEAEMAKPATTKTSVPGVYRRGERYLYAYRADGRQRWGSAATLDQARRGKRQAEADADRGELFELSRVGFGDYAREWVIVYQGRTSNGFRESTRRAYRQMLEARSSPTSTQTAACVWPRSSRAMSRASCAG